MTSATAKQAMPSPPPERAEPFGALALHGHRRADGVAEALLHLGAARRQLRRLEHDRAVDVAGRPTRRPHVGDRPAQQLEAVGAREGGVGVGEVLADVAQARRAERARR